MAPGNTSWQIGEGTGRWRDFPEDLNAEVEQAYLAQHDGVVYPWSSCDGNQTTEYCISFVAMEQTNQASGFVRRVRRLAVP